MSPWIRDETSSEGSQDVSSSPIAIVGMACRFPGDASNPEKFWDMLIEGRNAWSEIPSNRFEAKAFYHPDPDRKDCHNVEGAHFMDGDVAAFDAPFFQFSTTEANAMDPGQRHLLEVTYESFENAGLRMESLAGSQTGVYVGVMTHDYATITGRDPETASLYATTGNHTAILANRVSWFFDLQGPSITLDTACSSSIVCLNLACKALQTEEINVGVVGGVSMLLDPEPFISMSSLHMISPDGKSKSFDQRANGYGRGEGVATVILKRLDDAIRDGDTIRAVIRGTGVGQDGKTPGITLPSTQAQANLIRQTYENNGMTLDRTEYFEAHGTGTPAGDPLEMSAIATTFRTLRDTDKPLHVGSVKSQVGHLEGVSGLAGLIKIVQSLERGIIAPNYDFQTPNERIPMDDWNVTIPTAPVPWPTEGLRRASLSNYGFGGTNTHVVVDDAYHFLKEAGLSGNHNTRPNPPKLIRAGRKSDEEGLSVEKTGSVQIKNSNQSEFVDVRKRLFLLSSHEQDGIPRQAKSLSRWVSGKEPLDDVVSSNLAYTQSSRRSILPWKSFAVAGSDLADRLQTETARAIRSTGIPKLGFIFTGQGAQWARMGLELMAYPIFAESVHSADSFLRFIGADWSLLTELKKPLQESAIQEPRLSQPLCTALQVALVDLLRSWGDGLLPTSVVGHSSGEIAAAYCIGALTREAAWKIAYHRGRLSSSLKVLTSGQAGGMLAVGLGEADAQSHLDQLDVTDDDAVIACINSPKNVTIAGKVAVLQRLEDVLKSKDIFARRLKVETAYHSPVMNLVEAEYRRSLQGLLPNTEDVTIRMFSSVTGQEISPADLDADYWVQNMLSPVKFLQATTNLLSSTGKKRRRRVAASRIDALVEFGPSNALQGPCKQIIDSLPKEQKPSLYTSVLERNKDAVETALMTVGRLWAKGVQKIDFLAVNLILGVYQEVSIQSLKRCLSPQVVTDLPPYAWNHSKAFWIEGRMSKALRTKKTPRSDWVGNPVAHSRELEWRNFLRGSEQPWLKDHRVQDTILFPAAGMLVSVIEAMKQVADADSESLPTAGFELLNVVIGRALIVPASDEGVEIVTSLSPLLSYETSKASRFQFFIHSVAIDGSYVEHCRGTCRILYHDKTSELEQDPIQAEAKLLRKERLRLKDICVDRIASSKLNGCFERIGMNFGPLFRNIRNINCTEGAATFSTIIPNTKNVMPYQYEQAHIIHPATLDAFFQTVLSTVPSYIDLVKDPMVPTAFGRIFVAYEQPKDYDEAALKYHGFATATLQGLRKIKANQVAMFDNSNNNLCVLVEDYEMTSLSVPGMAQKQDPRKLCSEVVWQPAYGFMTSEQKLKMMPQRVIDVAWANWIQRSGDKTVAIHLSRALSKVDPEKVGQETQVTIKRTDFTESEEDGGDQQEITKTITREEKPHLKLYYEWAKKYVEKHRDTPVPAEFSSEDELVQRSIELSVDGQLLNALSQKLVNILENRTDPLEIMFNEEKYLIRTYRESEPLRQLNNYMASCIDSITFQNPKAEILEIGAGTGGTTKVIVDVIGGENAGTARWGSYTFTDVTPFVLKPAQEEFENWASAMQFQTLDIEKSVEEQGYRMGSYDVIIASNVVHVTQNIETSLKHIFSLLKPGGVLMLGEMSRNTSFSQSCFGLLPQWWTGALAGDESRMDGPTMPTAQWMEALKTSGFSDTIPYFDFENEASRCNTLFVSRKPAEVPLSRGDLEAVILMNDTMSSEVRSLSGAITEFLQSRQYSVTEMTLEEAAAEAEHVVETTGSSGGDVVVNEATDATAQDALRGAVHNQLNDTSESLEEEVHDLNKPVRASGKLVISLMEITEHILASCDEKTFYAFRRLLAPTGCASFFHITRGVERGGPNPLPMSTKGLMRSVRGEDPSRRMCTVDVDHSSVMTSPSVMQSLLRVLEYSIGLAMQHIADGIPTDSEFMIQDGFINVPRYLPELNMNSKMAQLTSLPKTEKASLLQAGKNFELKLIPGQLETIQFSAFELPSLGENEVAVMVKAAALSQCDVARAFNSDAEDNQIGDVAAGVITNVGKNVNNLCPGDRVVVLSPNSFSTSVVVHSQLSLRLPDDISFEKAAANVHGLAAAYLAVVKRGGLEPGDSILIHSAASSIGQLCIQLARLIGASEIFATVSSTEKRDLLCNQYGLKEDHIFDSTTTNYATGIRHSTSNTGVDVVISAEPVHSLSQSWSCLSQSGRLVYMGADDLNKISFDSAKENASFSTINLRQILRHDLKTASNILKNGIEYLGSGKVLGLEPNVDFSWAQIDEALTKLNSRNHIGKLVLLPKSTDLVSIAHLETRTLTLDPEATYLLSGGLGGLGRSIANHLVAKGARNLAFLSRSGAAKDSQKALLDNIRVKGAKAEAFACDISNEAALKATLQQISQVMPPIKGVMQLATSIEDVFFAKMSYSQWTSSTDPKIAGSWNLHNLLPQNDSIEFFILFSSIAGVLGNRGQANYAAGNSFVDGLAFHRRALGLNATVVNLPAVSDVGWIADNENISDAKRDVLMDAAGVMSINETELHGLLDIMMLGYSTGDNIVPTQVINCATGGYLLSRSTDSPFWGVDARFGILAQDGLKSSTIAGDADIPKLSKLLPQVTSLSEASELILSAMVMKIAKGLGVSPEDVDLNKPLHSFGVDSLVAVELRDWVWRETRTQLSVFDLLANEPIRALADKAAMKSELVSKEIKGEA